jgi:hypothetical protein
MLRNPCPSIINLPSTSNARAKSGVKNARAQPDQEQIKTWKPREVYCLVFSSPIDGEFTIQFRYNIKEFEVKILNQIITEERAKYLVEQESKGKFESTKKSWFGMSDDWIVSVKLNNGELNKYKINTEGKLSKS